MQEDILKIIEANLPKQVGEMLQERLAHVDSLENEVGFLRGKNASLEKQLKKLEASEMESLEKLELVMKRQEENEKRRLELDKREHEARVTEAEYRSGEAQKRSNDLFDLVKLVFKSPVFKKEIVESRMHSNEYMPNGQYQNVDSGCQKTETNTEE